MIYYGHQHITNEDIAAVREVLTSDFLTQGPAVARFERSVADYCGAAHAVAVTNATAALHIACQAAGLGRCALDKPCHLRRVGELCAVLRCGRGFCRYRR